MLEPQTAALTLKKEKKNLRHISLKIFRARARWISLNSASFALSKVSGVVLCFRLFFFFLRFPSGIPHHWSAHSNPLSRGGTSARSSTMPDRCGAVSAELTDGLSQSDDHFLACGELGDPANDSLHTVHPHFQLHGPHPEALIPPDHKGGTLRIFVHLWRKQRRFIINDTIQCCQTIIIIIPTLCGTTSPYSCAVF